MRSARLFTVAVFTLCSVCSPCSASADAPPDYSQDIADLQAVLELINQQLANLYNPHGPPVAQQQFDGRMDYLTQLVALIATNPPASSVQDVLASNPWWATNSTFALTRSSYNYANPDDGRTSSDMFSFPQFMSVWSGRLSYSENLPNVSQLRQWFNRWGTNEVLRLSGQELRRRSYTWFDWMSDATRSNLVLQASLLGTTDGPSNTVSDVASAVDDGSTSVTNGVPAMVVDRMDVNGIEDGLDLVDADSVCDMFPASFTAAEPRFLVFPGGRYGSVTVPVVAGSLEIPDNVARYLRGVATWLWRVALFVGCFVILRQEVAFWSTLGGSTSDA